MVQIHGDIFVTKCSRCEFAYPDRGGSPEPPGASENDVDLPRCPECDALMRPGVVWFGERLPWTEMQRVEGYLGGGVCDLVIVIGTTATFGYIIDWALRASRDDGKLIEVNPEETPLSQFATKLYRESATKVLPRLINEMFAG